MNIKFVKPLAFVITSVIASSMTTSAVQAAEITASQINTPPPELALPDAKSILMAKLAHLDYFSANFSQEVLSDSGEMLEQSSGKLAISKPNLANWHTQEPDELAIVSDGQDVWFYNPWIEQVSVYSLSAAIARTPILLLTSKDEALWQQYNVAKTITTTTDSSADRDSYVISAKDANSQIKSLTLVFEPTSKGGQLTQFSFLDATGQLSHIKLSDYDAKQEPAKSMFNFVVPDGVQIDDQRTN